MAITLGRNCSISVGGNVASARNVTLTSTARTINLDQFGSREVAVYCTGYDYSVSFECNNSSDVSLSNMRQGEAVLVSGGTGGWSFYAVITSVTETFSIDGVATFNVEAKLTKQGLR